MLDLNDVMNYVEKQIPAGKYEVEVLKSKLSVWGTGRQYIDLTVKIVDTIPSGMAINYDEYEDPIGQMLFPNVNLPVEGEKPGFIVKMLKDYITNYDVAIPEDGTNYRELAENFEGTIGGCIVKYKPTKRDDPDSPTRPEADQSCAVS